MTRGGGLRNAAAEAGTTLLQALCIGVAFYRGFRAPSLWSLNYYQVSWFDGFLRRGLLGTLLVPLGCARFDRHLVWCIQFAVLGAALLLLASRCRRGAALAGFCLFFLSSAGTLFFNEVGYPDQLLLLLEFACLGLLTRGKGWACAWILAVAILIHEEAAVTLVPLALARWWTLSPKDRPRAATLVLPSALAVAALVAFSTSVPFSTMLKYVQHAAACGHVLRRRDYLLYYGTPLTAPFGDRYHGLELRWVVLPLVLTLALWILPGAAAPGLRPSRRLALWAACVLPLGLGWIGTDKNRWEMLSLLQVVVALASGFGDATWSGPRRSLIRAAYAVPLVVVVFATRIALFDGFIPRRLDGPALRTFPAYVRDQFTREPLQ